MFADTAISKSLRKLAEYKANTLAYFASSSVMIIIF